MTDDWPEDVPVSEAEITLFEAWFGELFDELFGDGEGGHHHGSGSSGGSLPPSLYGAASRQRSLHPGRFWRAQFCTEVAHPTRFERVTFAFGGQRSIQLSYGRNEASCSRLARGGQPLGCLGWLGRMVA